MISSVDSWKIFFRDSKPQNVAKAKDLYMKVIQQGESPVLSDALYELSSLLENDSSSTSREIAFEKLVMAADRGHPHAQHRLAVAYMTGFYGGLIPLDPSRALLLEYMAALSGSTEANLALGHRYFKGVGVPERCSTAISFIEIAANVAAEEIERRGYTIFVDRTYLSQQHDAHYHKEIDDESFSVRSPHISSSLYLHGSRNVDQDLNRAHHFLRLAADKSHVHSSSHLGYLIAQGKVPGTPEEAIRLLQYGQEYRDVLGSQGLAYCAYKGIGMTKNETKAFEAFRSIADRVPDAAFFMGELVMAQTVSHHHDHNHDAESTTLMATAVAEAAARLVAQGESGKAMQAYNQAAQRGHILASHRVGHMCLKGIGTVPSCELAANALKTVAERGEWARSLTLAHRKLRVGDNLSALQYFTQMAATGIEPAQANAAYMLSRTYCPAWLTLSSAVSQSENIDMTQWPSKKTKDGTGDGAHTSDMYATSNKTECEKRALALYLQSASQGNSDALLKVGDLYYYGSAGLAVNKKEAAVYYQLAADLRNTHALFNLGLMHEIGDGVEQDFHLAKRLFDQAAEFDEAARLPRHVALFLLQACSSVLRQILVHHEITPGQKFVSSLLGSDFSLSSIIPSPLWFPFPSTSIPLLNGLPHTFSLPIPSIAFPSHWRSLMQIADVLLRPLGNAMVRAVEMLDGVGVLLEAEGAAVGDLDLILLLFAVLSFLYIHGWRNRRAFRRLPPRGVQQPQQR
eukprot:gene2981-5852_t